MQGYRKQCLHRHKDNQAVRENALFAHRRCVFAASSFITLAGVNVTNAIFGYD